MKWLVSFGRTTYGRGTCPSATSSARWRIFVQASLVIKDLVYEAEAKAKAKAKTFMKCPRGSSRPRPGLEDNKTGPSVLEIVV